MNVDVIIRKKKKHRINTYVRFYLVMQSSHFKVLILITKKKKDCDKKCSVTCRDADKLIFYRELQIVMHVL